ncbi:ADP-ribose glycohydrolase OARD1 isoform X2 [Ictalurus punctatus]|uniref:ADP-ribose glycohydrolase OARD1 isoform X2 n=1 Tax=Ictalurus punctatus TaxID=7998 RepID=A0A9F7TNY4_ICTPU|nr:ADP-ribose glycohydrolase OARD1 isoform X2 [Ictalurus punctatus]
MGSKLQYVSGNLFSCPRTDSLAHCISMDCKMGAGIAATFKRRFGGVNELLAQQKQPGECAVLKRGDRFVYYLISIRLSICGMCWTNKSDPWRPLQRPCGLCASMGTYTIFDRLQRISTTRNLPMKHSDEVWKQ